MVIVVKVGGSILGEGVSSSMLDDIVKVASNEKIIIVHGGGKEVTEYAHKLGKEQKFITSPDGFRSRFTDLETVKIFTMVMTGVINKGIVASLQKMGLSAIGLSGLDGNLIRAKRKKKLMILDNRNRKIIIDGGYTGKISLVNDSLLKLLLDENYLPVISPVAISEEFEYLNIDGDRAAAYIAGGVKAKSMIFLTNVQGVLMNGDLVEKMSSTEAESLRSQIGAGMEKKVLASTEAISLGVKECIIASGLADNPITSALNHIKCTVIVK